MTAFSYCNMQAMRSGGRPFVRKSIAQRDAWLMPRTYEVPSLRAGINPGYYLGRRLLGQL